jgi:hypothetical protein
MPAIKKNDKCRISASFFEHECGISSVEYSFNDEKIYYVYETVRPGYTNDIISRHPGIIKCSSNGTFNNFGRVELFEISDDVFEPEDIFEIRNDQLCIKASVLINTL